MKVVIQDGEQSFELIDEEASLENLFRRSKSFNRRSGRFQSMSIEARFNRSTMYVLKPNMDEKNIAEPEIKKDR
jgi:hypothetical protein